MGEVVADFKVLSNVARRVGLSVVLWAWPHSRARVGGLAMLVAGAAQYIRTAVISATGLCGYCLIGTSTLALQDARHSQQTCVVLTKLPALGTPFSPLR